MIIPGTRPTSRPGTDALVNSPARRLILPFASVDFNSNFQRGAVGSAAHARKQDTGSANETVNTSAHFSHRNNYIGPGSDVVIPATDQQFNDMNPVIPTETSSHSPPSQSGNRRSSPTERRESPSASTSREHLSRANNTFRNTESIRATKTTMGLGRSQTPPHCGDLEGYGEFQGSPATRTPNNVRPSRQGDARSRGCDVRSSVSRRTHSRASNISRKRRFAGIDYQTSEPDRKRLAMSEAVKHWNECIQITTEESDRAKSAISHLKRKLQRQSSELETAQHTLQTSNRNLQALQKQYESLQAKDSRAAEDKSELEIKFKELSTDYEKLRAQMKEIPSRYSSCKDKLDTVISEQREVFNKSRSFYDGLSKKIKDDEARAKANAGAVEQALQSSKQKRDELKKFVEHMQRVFESRKSEYEHKIQCLEEKNEAQCDHIDTIEEDKEKLYKEMIASRSTKACLDGVNAQLSGFGAQIRALDASKDTLAIELNAVTTSRRLHDLPNNSDFRELQAQMSASDRRMGDLEKLIRENLLSAIESISSKQTESQASMGCLATMLEASLAKVQSRIQNHAIELNKTINNDNNSRAEAVKQLKLIATANGDLSSRVEVANSRLENLSEDISARSAIGTSITAILEEIQNLSERNDKILAAQGKQAEATGSRHKELAAQIDSKAINHEKVVKELVDGIKDQLGTTLSTIADSIAARAVNSDGKLLSADKKSLAEIESLRSNLQQIEARLSKVDKVPSSLQKIYDLSLLIEETSKYMGKEEVWVRQIMDERLLDSDVSATTHKSPSQELSSQHSVSSSNGLNLSSQESSTGDTSDIQIRKVVVHSPKMPCNSPLPVSQAQEQRRRRGVARPRSILKQTQAASMIDMSQSQPVSIRSGNHYTSEDVFEEIRPALVQSPGAQSQSSSHQTTGLTSMSDYLKFAKGTNRSSTAVLGDLVDAEAAFGNIISPPNCATTA
ncbi:hypothetical protein NLG97_g502 [Lecanicillium saksenae]|uniref:Uncharacterized protein n=1 Tax=Lecanicillium saksenae TaxID=468837 RepID=A0ACC1RAI5_9HYPO|nr:hypothetical protein NLG97_g502 [Lecanicillium saksenae]